MNNTENFNSRKYIFLLIIVCILFLILVIKAFDYLPKSDINTDDSVFKYSSNENTQIMTDSSNADKAKSEDDSEEEKDDEESDPERHKSGHIDFMRGIVREANPEIEEINPPKEIVEEPVAKTETEKSALTNDELALQHIVKGLKFKSSKDYENALSEFQQVQNLTSNNELKAQSFENIAEIYAYNRKYGTALSFATKAYNTSPSPSREMLITRIYYKSGKSDEAITRMNNMLKKGF